MAFGKKLIPFISLLILFCGCSSTDIINSKWTDEPVPMSAQFDDWRNKTFYVQDKSLMVGVQNDNDYLYLALITGDRSNKMQILGRGLSVWFDKEGGKDKYFGVKFPDVQGRMFFQKTGSDENSNNEDMITQLLDNAKSSTTIDVLGPGENNVTKVPISDSSGINAQVDIINDVLIYKLRIPLKKDADHTYGIGINNFSSQLGIGVETPEFKRSGNDGEHGREQGEHHGMGRGKFNGNRGNIPQQLQYWCDINLAMKKP